MAIWPFLLVGCAITAFFNWKMALIFAVHLIAMQGIKYLALPQQSVLFFACYSATALIALLFLDRIAAFTLAIVAFAYAASLIGMIGITGRAIFGEIAFVVAMIAGAWNGPDRGILVVNSDPDSHRPAYAVDRLAMRKDENP